MESGWSARSVLLWVLGAVAVVAARRADGRPALLEDAGPRDVVRRGDGGVMLPGSVPQPRPQREPDIDGVAPAWKCSPGVTPAPPDATPLELSGSFGRDGYLIHSPHSHPFWAWHFIAGVHLRPIDGMPPPHLQFPEATHEIFCFAIDPTRPLPDPDDWHARETGLFLQSPDWVVQFTVDSDEQARGVFDAVMRAATEGVSVDSDLRRWWEESITTTALHFRQGEHT